MKTTPSNNKHPITDLKWLDEERPKTRDECRDGYRPCPWVMCRYHLYLEINPKTGQIRLNFPSTKVWNLKYSCALDIADQGPSTLKEVGSIFRFSRERVRQLETRGLYELKKHLGLLIEFVTD